MSIQDRFLRSSIWTMSASGVNALSSTMIFIALARLLSPEELGTVVFATIFIEIARIIVIAGIPDALIQREDWNQTVADTAFWTSTVLALTIAAGLSLAAPFMAISGGEDFPLVLAALSLILIVEGTACVHTAKLRREFKDKFIAQRTMASNITGGLIGVGLAVMGLGVWAMVLGRLIAVSASSLILWFSSGFFPRLHFSGRAFREFAAFSSHQLGSNLLASVNLQVIPMIVGAFLGASALAQYRVATRAMSLVSDLVIAPLRSTTMSAFSRVREDKGSIVTAYLKVTRFCALVACPAYLGIAATAPDIVAVVFGNQYRQAGFILTGLALVGGPIVLNSFQTPALASVGRTGLAFTSVLTGFIASIAIALSVIGMGPVAVAYGQTARVYLTTPFALFLVQKGTGVRVLDALRNVAPPFFAAVLMAILVLALRWSLLADWEPLWRLCLSIAVGGLAYAIVMLVAMRSFAIATLDSARDLVPARARTHFDKLRRKLRLIGSSAMARDGQENST